MVHELDPLTDARWQALVQSHPDSTVFHSPAWLQALQRTYGYRPLVLTTSPAGEPLRNAVVFCRVESWLTGRRLVSLPFSDHCAPLVEDKAGWRELVSSLGSRIATENLRYVEFRPAREVCVENYASSSYYFHQLDLSIPIETLFGNLHAASIQRKIRRAEREALQYSEGQSSMLLDAFYDLLLRTRKRHALPPQPKDWFRNLIATFGPELKIRVAYKDNQPIAAILTLRHGHTMVYKYGCSDETMHPLGGMQMLMWRTIQEGKQQGLTTLDMGRSDRENSGLVTYKDRWGAQRSELTYLRCTQIPAPPGGAPAAGDWKMRAAAAIFSRLPAAISSAAGGVLYRHFG